MTSPFPLRVRPIAFSRLAACAVAALLTLSACGGGGGGSSTSAAIGSSGSDGAGTVGTGTGTGTGSTGTGTGTTTTTPDVIPTNYQSYANLCAAPRSGVDAYGATYPDQQGTLLDEMKFLRGWIDTTYLWYDEVPDTVHMADYTDAISYFNVLKTTATTASGKLKDRFHFTYTTAEWDALNVSQDLGYGLTWSRNQSTAPRTWLAAIVEPGSPAATAGILRGDLVTAIDGLDFVNTSDSAGVARLNAGLSPASAGEQHVFTLQRGTTVFDVTLTATVVTTTPVKNVKLIDTPTGKVGYLSFEDHNIVAEKQLANAFTTLKAGGATDLVLDMRYNGGGYLYIASELAYMIAGPAASGKTFEQLVYNAKTTPANPITFESTGSGYTSASVPSSQALPYLGLKHVTVLTTADTCSASEAVINGLRGIDVQVDVIGATTCGKPYAFVPQDNCGTTYFAIQSQGLNAKGFGDYGDGMTPTCAVADDLAHALGDPAENLLATALAYRSSNTCPATASTARASAVQMHIARSQMKEIAIDRRMLRR